MKKYLVILVIITLAIQGLQAQKFTATSNYAKIALNKSFQVTFTLTGGNASKFIKPAFTGFTVAGTSTGTVISNGSYKLTWTYTLKPTAVGTYTIDEAKVNVNGSWISSNTLSIEVTASTSTTTNSNTTANSNSSTTTTTTTATSSTATSTDIFLKAYADKTTPYVGEQVMVTYKIYTRIPVTQYGIEKLPSYTGFWSEELTENGDEVPQTKETINGIQYTVAEVRKVVLFPEKSGTLTIDPLDISCVVRVVKQQQIQNPFADLFNDPFFNIFNNNTSVFNTYSEEEKTITSNSLTLNVKALPVADQPSEFNGSVGSFTFDAELDKTELKTNEAANLKFTLKGTGNISLAELPDINFPADIETYDPDVENNIVPSGTGVSGTKTFSYLLIPKSAGEFTIPSVKFSYFDLTKKEYVTLESPEFTMKVEKGDDDEASASGKEDVKHLNSDINYIKASPSTLSRVGMFFYGSPLFFGLLALPVFLFLLFAIIYRRKLKENSNLALKRNRKATSVANKRLHAANSFLKENKKDAFLDEIFKALWGYVSDKLSIPLSELSKETITEKFAEKNVNEEISKQFIATLNTCEYARFSPDEGSLAMNSIYSEAEDIITKMERELR